ncbi:MAG: Translation elongation factor P Lys34:lysine transferase [uncultured Thiotrichaceae bacterium]|uniref:Translation elongation factor P Lys34:lysine transferase n=1 Tax=uncultured Thiotrichaceae bacterium TaxID=298394 RepID=A0A6S6SMY0_9GAMM|nr:MAG: Translation elongation factor P Lys34:lysine transferase [uncultured Thiotrichaceae bacterium]
MLDLLQERARVMQMIRAFFLARDVLEVETPCLSQAGNTDPFIESFCVEHAGHPGGKRYLHTSPEYPMKRLLAQGSGDIYQLCKVWRQEEQGSKHNSEFTMLEWYRVGMSYEDLMKEVVDLLQDAIPQSSRKPPRFIAYKTLFLEKLSINPHQARTEDLFAAMVAQNIHVAGELDHGSALDILMTHIIEPSMDAQRLTVVYDYPQQQQALSQVVDGVAKRFEVYFAGLELANGYQELVDAAKNRQVLMADSTRRESNQQSKIPVDERFLAALDKGIPACAGVAVGIDRVMMCRLEKKHIEDVISFPWGVA